MTTTMLPFLPATSVLGGGGPSAGEKSDDADGRRGEDDGDAASSLRDSAETLAAIDARYESVGCIGRGGFGSVFLARSRASGRKVREMEADKRRPRSETATDMAECRWRIAAHRAWRGHRTAVVELYQRTIGKA